MLGMLKQIWLKKWSPGCTRRELDLRGREGRDEGELDSRSRDSCSAHQESERIRTGCSRGGKTLLDRVEEIWKKLRRTRTGRREELRFRPDWAPSSLSLPPCPFPFPLALMQQQPGRPTPVAPSNSTSLPASHGFSVSTAAMLAGQPKVTSIPSYLPTHPHRDPSAPAYPVYPDHSKEYHKQIPSPYQAGAVSRPQQYAGNPNYPQPGGGGASGVASGSGTGGGGGPGSRGPYQKKGPGPFAVPRKSQRVSRWRASRRAGRRKGGRGVELELTSPSFPLVPPLLLVKQMMFGFGDEPDAPEDTVAVMEDLLGHFVQELVRSLLLPAPLPRPSI